MSKIIYTDAELIREVRLRAGLPGNAAGAQLGTRDSDIRRIINGELLHKFVPGVMKPKEYYFTKTIRVPVTATNHRYRMPKRAVGNKLNSVSYIQGTSRSPVQHMDKADLSNQSSRSSSGPIGFYLESNDIVLYPDLGTSAEGGELEITFFLRPGQIVPIDEVATVNAVDTTARTITFNETIPPTGFMATSIYDVHSPQSGAEVKQLELTGTALDGNVLTVSEAIDGSVFATGVPAVGDYVVLTGEAALPALPVELHIPLALSAAITILTTLDIEMAALKQQDLQMMLGLAGYYIDSRVEGQPKKIVSSRPFSGTGYRN